MRKNANTCDRPLFDATDFCIRYEAGEIEDAGEVIDGFQELIDSGLAWRLQGNYGRTAAYLIRSGYCMD